MSQCCNILVMNDSQSITRSRLLPKDQRLAQILRWVTGWLLRMLALLLTGMMAYLWNGLSPRALLCFDRTGLDPGEVGFGLPVAYGETWVRCLGPVGWIAGLGTFALA